MKVPDLAPLIPKEIDILSSFTRADDKEYLSVAIIDHIDGGEYELMLDPLTEASDQTQTDILRSLFDQADLPTRDSSERAYLKACGLTSKDISTIQVFLSTLGTDEAKEIDAQMTQLRQARILDSEGVHSKPAALAEKTSDVQAASSAHKDTGAPERQDRPKAM